MKRTVFALAATIAACSPPDSTVTGEASGEVIVGTSQLESPNCYTHTPQVESAQVEIVARYTRGDTGEVCSGILVTQDSLLLVPTRCLSDSPAKLGTAVFTIYPLGPGGCGITSPVPTSDIKTYKAIDETVGWDPVRGLALVRLGKNSQGQTAAQRHGSAPLGINKGATTHQTIRSDGLVTVAVADVGGPVGPVILFSDNCSVSAPGDHRHNCDTMPSATGLEMSDGGMVSYAQNGCIGPQQVGGLCNVGGPQSPGAGVSRMVGVTRGPDGSGLNAITYLSELTCAGCLLEPHLTPGNFVPLASRSKSRPVESAAPPSPELCVSTRAWALGRWEESMQHDDEPVTERVAPATYQMRPEVEPDLGFADEVTLEDGDLFDIQVIA